MTTAPPTDTPTAVSADGGAFVRATGRGRSLAGWVFIVVAVLGAALLAIQVAANPPSLRAGLDPESAGPAGARALAELVRQQGIEVEVVRDRTAAAAALDDDSLLVLTDPYPLSDEAALDLVDAADATVLLSSSARMLRLLDLGDTAVGGGDLVGPACPAAEFARVGEIAPDRVFEPAAGVTGCFGDAEGAAVLVDEDAGERRILVEGARLFGNERLAENGNAALGLALLGQRPHVVWYVPSFADSDLTADDAAPTLGELTPDWVTPVILLLIVATIVAGIWRGRRFGPLVAETLPVTVRASETMQGRARLTARAADAPHAAAEIRTGAIVRLSKRLAIPAAAGTDAVADAAADRIRASRDSVRALLAGPLPATDPELVAYARRLAELETAVDDVVRTERSTP